MSVLAKPLPMAFASHLPKASKQLQPTISKATTKKEGDISSVFVSLSGAASAPLPERFVKIKRDLVRGHENALLASWKRLLRQLATENDVVARRGPSGIPQIAFQDLSNPSPEFLCDVKRCGVAVVRNVIPEAEARAYKQEAEQYIASNPGTKAFPKHDPQVYELYWSPPQVKARSHPNLLATQRFLMSLWQSKDDAAPISTLQPLTYADRLRIRQPGDSGFALGPHVDGGSVERWEPNGYGVSGAYDKIWQGKWEEYDPWESSCRINAASDLYDGAGACSMFRMFQGWLGMSRTSPGEGTLMVNPRVKLATAYFLLRPFFSPVQTSDPSSTSRRPESFWDVENWVFNDDMTNELQGATPGHAQELNDVLHPHLELARTMVHVPDIKPGDFVAWHCDTIHAVDKVHMGKSDSSVIYIPVCPVTGPNAEYLARQRDTFLSGFPGPDFPGGKGESEHVGRPDYDFVQKYMSSEGLQGMGLQKLNGASLEMTIGSETALQAANTVLGF